MWLATTLILLGLVVLGLAWKVYAARPSHTLNRRLAIVLAWSAWIQMGPLGLRLEATDPAIATGLGTIFFASVLLVPFVYGRFLATLPSRWLRWLRPWYVQGGLLVGPALFLLGIWTGNARIELERFKTQRGYSVLLNEGSRGPFTLLSSGILLILFALALVAMVGLYRKKTGLLRRQWGYFGLGFALYNSIFITFMAALVFIPGRTAWLHGSTSGEIFQIVTPTIALTCLVAFLAYGILQSQVFDIQLRIQWAAARALMALMFVLVFLIVGTVATEWFLDEFGYLAGGIAAGLLLFAIGPLQRATEALARRAMPGVTDSKEYRKVRKTEVYQAACEAAMLDGTVTAKERDVLASLAHSLELGPLEVRAIERALEARPSLGS